MHSPLSWLGIDNGMFSSLVMFNIKLFVGGCVVLFLVLAPHMIRRLPKREFTNHIEEAMNKNREKHRGG